MSISRTGGAHFRRGHAGDVAGTHQSEQSLMNPYEPHGSFQSVGTHPRCVKSTANHGSVHLPSHQSSSMKEPGKKAPDWYYPGSSSESSMLDPIETRILGVSTSSRSLASEMKDESIAEHGISCSCGCISVKCLGNSAHEINFSCDKTASNPQGELIVRLRRDGVIKVLEGDNEKVIYDFSQPTPMSLYPPSQPLYFPVAPFPSCQSINMVKTSCGHYAQDVPFLPRAAYPEIEAPNYGTHRQNCSFQTQFPMEYPSWNSNVTQAEQTFSGFRNMTTGFEERLYTSEDTLPELPKINPSKGFQTVNSTTGGHPPEDGGGPILQTLTSSSAMRYLVNRPIKKADDDQCKDLPNPLDVSKEDNDVVEIFSTTPLMRIKKDLGVKGGGEDFENDSDFEISSVVSDCGEIFMDMENAADIGDRREWKEGLNIDVRLKPGGGHEVELYTLNDGLKVFDVGICGNISEIKTSQYLKYRERRDGTFEMRTTKSMLQRVGVISIKLRHKKCLEIKTYALCCYSTAELLNNRKNSFYLWVDFIGFYELSGLDVLSWSQKKQIKPEILFGPLRLLNVMLKADMSRRDSPFPRFTLLSVESIREDNEGMEQVGSVFWPSQCHRFDDLEYVDKTAKEYILRSKSRPSVVVWCYFQNAWIDIVENFSKDVLFSAIVAPRRVKGKLEGYRALIAGPLKLVLLKTQHRLRNYVPKTFPSDRRCKEAQEKLKETLANSTRSRSDICVHKITVLEICGLEILSYHPKTDAAFEKSVCGFAKCVSMSDTLFGFNRSNVVLAAGIAGAAFVGYCIYFDHKRTTAPDYKDKIRQKRRADAAARGGIGLRSTASAGRSGEMNLSDPAMMQAFFLQEVQLGEELMGAGNIEEGSTHIANAVVLCGESQQLLSIFQQTLSEEQFRAVLVKLPSTRERLASMFGKAADSAEDEPPTVQYIGDGPAPSQIQELIDDTDDLE
ncbi:unnamed protein product [Caenorhabditis auriculariae]|uniref:Mitochondrial import receptor subunit TOM20 homolog n=1 Tax=Caenorhabditis auriculariae TaxID=2777116 RepID=A0A8S1GVU4_9PELO|nr:unnamed protein product [Caenorhabditis auriculariae]